VINIHVYLVKLGNDVPMFSNIVKHVLLIEYIAMLTATIMINVYAVKYMLNDFSRLTFGLNWRDAFFAINLNGLLGAALPCPVVINSN